MGLLQTLHRSPSQGADFSVEGDFFFKEDLFFDGDSMGVATPDYSGVLQRSLENTQRAHQLAARGQNLMAIDSRSCPPASSARIHVPTAPCCRPMRTVGRAHRLMDRRMILCGYRHGESPHAYTSRYRLGINMPVNIR